MNSPLMLYILARQRLLTSIMIAANIINVFLILSFGLWFWGACIPMLTLAMIIGFQAHLALLQRRMWTTVSKFIEHNNEGGTIPDSDFHGISEIVRLYSFGWRVMQMKKFAGNLHFVWGLDREQWTLSSRAFTTSWSDSKKIIAICRY